jgi:hypothetical protein
MGLPAKIADAPKPMRDRSNLAAQVLVLEATVMALARAYSATLDVDAKSTFAKEIVANVDLICSEVIAQAPVTGRGANLAPGAAKAAAARLHADALELINDLADELVGK